jgi:hypothetical protein
MILEIWYDFANLELFWKLGMTLKIGYDFKENTKILKREEGGE